MKTRISIFIAVVILVFSLNANATVLNFIQLTEDPVNGLGESSWSTLALGGAFLGLSITGHATIDNDVDGDPSTPDLVPDVNQFAYLDWGTAGLGVCKDAIGAPSGSNTGSSGNSCAPRSDDNVTVDEYLEISFDQSVVIENIWFNNNHDHDGLNTGDLVTIGGTDFEVANRGYAPGMVGFSTTNGVDADGKFGIGSFYLDGSDTLTIAFNNEQFYVSGIEFSAVPVPAAFWLFGTALIGFVGLSRRTTLG